MFLFTMPVLHCLSQFQIPERQDTPWSVSQAPSFRLRSLLVLCAHITAAFTCKPTTLLGELVKEMTSKVFRLPCISLFRLCVLVKLNAVLYLGVGSLLCSIPGVLWRAHSGCSPKGHLASDPKAPPLQRLHGLCLTTLILLCLSGIQIHDRRRDLYF